jgi:hypothetical protein
MKGLFLMTTLLLMGLSKAPTRHLILNAGRIQAIKKPADFRLRAFGFCKQREALLKNPLCLNQLRS